MSTLSLILVVVVRARGAHAYYQPVNGGVNGNIEIIIRRR